MTWLRHAGRHVHHTVANYVEAQLTDLSWLDPANVPFGAAAAPVTIIRTPAIIGGKLGTDIVAGTLAITLGDEFQPDMEELGGPLASQEYPIFFDVFQLTDAAALALASDIRDILLGRLPGTQRWHPVINQATGGEAVGWQLEIEDVERVSPDNRLALPWQVVKATATCYFPEVIY